MDSSQPGVFGKATSILQKLLKKNWLESDLGIHQP